MRLFLAAMLSSRAQLAAAFRPEAGALAQQAIPDRRGLVTWEQDSRRNIVPGEFSSGSEATVSGEQPIGGRYAATVEVIDPLIDSRSGTFGIRLVLPNPEHKIPAGLRCKIEFPILQAGP